MTSDTVHEDEEHDGHNGEHIDQSDKPRAGIAAEYLARGYTLSDQILQRAIELDSASFPCWAIHNIANAPSSSEGYLQALLELLPVP